MRCKHLGRKCSTFLLTLSNLVGVPRLWGGCAFLYRMAKGPQCMPTLTQWITLQDAVVIFLQEAKKRTYKYTFMCKCVHIINDNENTYVCNKRLQIRRREGNSIQI